MRFLMFTAWIGCGRYNVDRKVALPDNFRKIFNLPEREARVGKFTCSLGNNFGQLHVTSAHLCFFPPMGKKITIALRDVKQLAKKKRFFFSLGNGHGLHVTDTAATYEFNAITDRDACLHIILGQCGNAGFHPTVLEVGQ